MPASIVLLSQLMIVQLGQRSIDGDVDALLLECHVRIRRFLAVAGRIANQPASEHDVKAAAGQVQRYFAVGFPLHLADEDELVMPRLFGRDANLDRALSRMHAEHGEHDEHVTRLVDLCAVIERQPDKLPQLRRDLATAAERLTVVLEPHLRLEEREIFPSLRFLTPTRRDEIRAAMRVRREDTLFGGSGLAP